MNRILIVEDEPRIVSFLEKGLRAQGYTTVVAPTAHAASQIASSENFELLLLDLNLPGDDGLSVLAELRGQGDDLPVIILSARSDLRDKIVGLDGGANDYLTKPFRFEELLARVRVQMRPKHTVSPQESQVTLSHGRISLNLLNRKAQIADQEIELSSREFSLLEMFLRHPAHVLSREQLLSHIWGYDFEPGSNVVEVHIRNLRMKVGSDLIQTVRGMGYRLVI